MNSSPGLFRAFPLFLCLCLLSFLPVKADSFLQSQQISFSLNNATIKRVIEEIKKQTNLSFVYNELDIKGIAPFDIRVEDKNVEEVLEQVLKNKPLRYEIVDNVIVIRRDNRPVESSQQTVRKTVSGTVKDENGVALPGVAIRVKGTTTGVATDIDGNYTLVYEDNGHIVLEYSFIGMKTHEEKPGNRSVINVQLQSTATEMEEVMVIAYGMTKKEAFTGSAVSVKGDQVMREAAGAVSPEKALKGYVAGVRISRGGGNPVKL